MNSMSEHLVRLIVNGKPYEVQIKAHLTLHQMLQHKFGLTGSANTFCDHGVCGACMGKPPGYVSMGFPTNPTGQRQPWRQSPVSHLFKLWTSPPVIPPSKPRIEKTGLLSRLFYTELKFYLYRPRYTCLPTGGNSGAF
jgi:hypothetical protein